MNPGAKLTGFAATLAAVSGAAALAGGAVGPVHRTATNAGHGMAAMAERAAPVRGLAVSEDGLTLQLARTAAPRGERFPLAFRIAGRDGRTVRHFDVEHTRRMHLIVVRRDLTGFQHLHPAQRADGTWTVPVKLRDPGAYRVLADFAVKGEAHTLAGDLSVDGAVRSEALPAPARSVAVDGLRVSLSEGATTAGAESELRFSVSRAGRPVAIGSYLGAKGHLVALREGDLAFLHVHPDARSLKFMATFPTAGRYRMFLQFKTTDGRLHTAAFTQEVTR